MPPADPLRCQQPAKTDHAQLYQLLISELTDFAVFLTDPDGYAVSWNPGVERVLGYTEEQWLGHLARRLFTPEDQAQGIPEKEMAVAVRDGRAADIRWHQRKDGSLLFVEGTMVALKESSGALLGFSKIMRDVTNRKLAEERLQDALAYSESIIDTVREPLVVLDDELRVCRTNRAFNQKFKIPPEEIYNCPLHEFGNGQWNIPRLRTLLQEVISHDTTMENFEAEHNFGDHGNKVLVLNARRLVREANSTTFILLAIEDITERRRAEQEHLRASEGLRRREWRTRRLLESNVIGILVADLRGPIVEMNDAMLDLVGYTREELQNGDLRWDRMTPPEWMHASLTATSELRSKGVCTPFEKEYIRKDGSRVPILAGAALLPDEPDLCISYVLDLSAQKKVEAERERLLQDLKRSNEELSQFAHVASHDLKAPLQTVTNFAQLLQRRYKRKLDSQAEEYIRIIVEGGKRMSRLVADLLQFAELSTDDKEPVQPVDVESVLSTCLTNLNGMISETNATITHGPLPIVVVSETRLLQVFQNLIGNAMTYRRLEEPPKIDISAQKEADTWLFSIVDNGIGVPEEHRTRIFEPFRRLHGSERPGSGLGLAITKRIVERHGGRLWVEGRPAHGTTFCFTLPKA